MSVEFIKTFTTVEEFHLYRVNGRDCSIRVSIDGTRLVCDGADDALKSELIAALKAAFPGSVAIAELSQHTHKQPHTWAYKVVD